MPHKTTIKYKTKYKNYKQKYIMIKSIYDTEYPYYNQFYSLDIDKFQSLVTQFKPIIINTIPQNMKTKIAKYQGKYLLIQEDWDGNEELNNVTDYFTENCRVRCQFTKHQSPLDYWTTHKQNIMKELIKQHTTNLTIKMIRDYIYQHTKLCNNFRITVAISILQIFSAKRWLDISAGWGDRLCAAIACDVDLYCGVDPNECLHPGYDKMVRLLVPEKKQANYILIKGGFENVKLPDTKFDIVFSSPPFFDYEIYSDSKDDSVLKYSNINSWYTNFLIASLDKAMLHLEKGGHMVLYMGEGIHTSYINDMIDYIDTLMVSKGSIYYFYPNSRTARQLYVWQTK